jgi:hypothetical protein
VHSCSGIVHNIPAERIGVTPDAGCGLLRGHGSTGWHHGIVLAGRAIASLAVAVAAAGPGFSLAPRSAPPAGVAQARVTGLGVSCHARFDRLVVDSAPRAPGFSAAYAARVVGASGIPTRVRGSARIRLVLRSARAHTAAGGPTIPRVVVSRCRTLLEVKLVEDFEGDVMLALGTRGHRPFRVVRSGTPGRLVLDVAH